MLCIISVNKVAAQEWQKVRGLGVKGWGVLKGVPWGVDYLKLPRNARKCELIHSLTFALFKLR